MSVTGCVASLYRALVQEGFSAGALHGDMDQYKRLEWLEKFRKDEVRILVCSDVAARGLDIPRVSHVFNFDVPTHAEDYVHRIGRTGRAGRKGHSVTLASSSDDKLLASIEKLIGKKIPRNGGSDAESAVDSEEPVQSGAPDDKKSSGSSRKSRSKSNAAGKDTPRETRTGRGRKPANEDSMPDVSKVPFGETEFVPAFLRR